MSFTRHRSPYAIAALWIIMLFYMAMVCKLILFKQSPRYVLNALKKEFSIQKTKNNIRQGNLEPMKTIQLYMNSRLSTRTVFENIGGNIIAFIPFGFLLPILIRRYFRYFLLTCIAGLCFSLFLEISQAVTGLGRFDVDDLILNTAGAATGFIFFFFIRITTKRMMTPVTVQTS